MSGAINGLQSERGALLEACGRLDGAEWAAPSGCPGWSVKDVVSHVGATMWMVVDPSRLPDTGDLGFEPAQEVHVAARRAMSPDEVLSDYETVSAQAIQALGALETQDFELPLGDAGTYHASILPTAFCFDHYVHLRDDLFSPRGPLRGAPTRADPACLTAALEWIEAALPQQNAPVLADLDATVEFTLDQPRPATIRAGAGPVVTTVKTDNDTFIRCITGRSSWDVPGVEIRGGQAARAALEGLRVY